MLMCTSISFAEPIALSKCRLNSFSKRLFAQPSAMFAGIDFEALLNCDPRSFFSKIGEY